jgi:hypothetical protein
VPPEIYQMRQESFRSISFSLAQLLGAIAVIAMFVAAIVNPGGIWSAFCQLFVFGILAYAVLSVIYRTGASRAFWIGFALFGWGFYLVEQLEFGDARARFAPIITRFVRSNEVLNGHYTSRVTAELQNDLPPGTNVPLGGEQFLQRMSILRYSLVNNLLILIILVFATIGGLFGVALQRSQQKKQNNETTG